MYSMIKFQSFMFSILFIIIGTVGYWYQIGTLETLHITLKDKQRVTTDAKFKYMIFSTTETFEDTDSFYHQKHDSSDLYNSLKVGCSYELSVYGKRIPFFNMYRNIVALIKEEPCP